jgi:hypothetical protein
MDCANCANCANSHWMPRAGDQSFGHQDFSSRLLRNLQNLQNPGSLPNLATGRSRKPESRNLPNPGRKAPGPRRFLQLGHPRRR